ncbi:MAG TPA: ATP-binding cassette domain-containing protein, partial [Desulfurivibrionaceae bacterium]|nr:ATP-binding cassette domain-containing protein [Desulfurivibrionaceae bacterium]
MYAVQIENLTKIYGQGHTEVVALADASFDVAPGELVAILGPSGSGKTTLLTTIGLVTEPTRGKVVLDGELIAEDGWPPGLDLKRIRREKLGFIFQAHNLIPFLTAVENVMIALENNGVGAKAARERSIELLESLGLGHRLNH